MKEAIHGFSQSVMVACGLDITDWLILNWFMWIKQTTQVKRIVFEGKEYCLLSHTKLLEDYPVLASLTESAFESRLRAYAVQEILKSATVDGTTYFQVGGAKMGDLLGF